ncbi:prolyl oligopeptidase family serine peptidase [Beduinella massiliensis]|uniref:prolyl oligopeptidase family serine peptidase n=1 Tax=Beduinella massiliensis TaxID=1852363 RepID=UPI000C862556
MQKLKLEDFLHYQYASELSFAPGGAHAAFVVTRADEQENSYRGALYVLETKSGESRPLTARDGSGYFWDGEDALVFPALREQADRKRAERGEALTVFYRIALSGGEAQEWLRLPYRVKKVKKLADGRLVMACEWKIGGPDFASMTDAQREAALKALEEERDYEVLDEIPFWGNGQGFINKKRTRLLLCEPDGGRTTFLTAPEMDVDGFETEGARVLYVGAAPQGKRGVTSGVYLIDVDGGQEECLLADGRLEVERAAFWQGEAVCLATDMARHGLNENPALYALRGGEAVRLFSRDEAPGSNVAADARYGSGYGVRFEGGDLYYTNAHHTDTQLLRVKKDGSAEVLVDGAGSIDCFDVCDGRILLVGMRGLSLQEVYALTAEGLKQLTNLNGDFLKTRTLSIPEPLTVESDGVAIEGFVLKPVDFDPQKRYPGILDIHGGPKVAFGSVFFHEMQVWANDGYFVFFCNPRGGDGRGDAFADIRGKYGTIDYDDLMRFTDAALARYPQLDPARLGVTGGSYGGFMTNWIIGHTDRFAAAASQRSIANWISKTNMTDIGYYFNTDQQLSTPWENHEKMWWHSPVKYADRCVTPTLFIHSDEDYRCCLAEGLQMFTALKYHGCEARLCMFRGENHELSRSGKPKHRVRRLREIGGWFDEHLKK